jgi:hypothetical protein
VDTNGFDWTVNSPLTSTTDHPVFDTINKVGAGIWTLTQGGQLIANV